MNKELQIKGQKAKAASRILAPINSERKNSILETLANLIVERETDIIEANLSDLRESRENGLNDALLDRLMLNSQRLRSIANDVRCVVNLADPVGSALDSRVMGNGLNITRQRVPLGVIGVIYESRPNVTIDISALCLKSGNAVILRGGKEARRSNQALAAVVTEACRQHQLPDGTVQLIESADRELVGEMLRAEQYIDMIIPRGGQGLHDYAKKNATIPVITGGIGICHIYVDDQVDAETVVPIVQNAKVQRPTVCNALDTLLVHQDRAEEFLPKIYKTLAANGVEFRCDPAAMKIADDHPNCKPAGEDDFDTEFLSLVLAVKVVSSMEEAIEHIYQHSTRHSDSILTTNYQRARQFVSQVDSAAVYVNASTRFTDGAQFGLGAEVAVSTQRVHARGPMGLEALTTYKWIVLGDGHVRP